MRTSVLPNPAVPNPAVQSPTVSTQLDFELVQFLEPNGTLLPHKSSPDIPVPRLVEIYRAMVRTRVIDQRLTAMQRQGRIGFHVGCIGEEATVIAAAAALREQDWIFPCYREVGALLWRGFPLQTYIHNMFGNAEDVVHGRQMPDHYTGKAYRYGSVSSPVGTQITQAAGLAWAAKLRGDDVVSAVYFGEGATSSNDFHAGMNFAGVQKLPVIFLCRNNQWAISVPASRQTAAQSFAVKALAYGATGVRCDGNDSLAVYHVVQEAMKRAAAGGGPTLVELVTYRLDGHSTSDDPRVYRSDEELATHRERGPLTRLNAYLKALNAWSDQDDQAWHEAVEKEFKQCVQVAEATAKPDIATLFTDVYAKQPAHLQRQQELCERGPRPKGDH